MLVSVGCGGRGTPDLGKVSGTVTLDGQPLPQAKVEFQPTADGGSASSATTDDQGKYELMYSVGIEGAQIGEHKVRITSYRQEHVEGSEPREIPERVPPQYNSQTELIKTVEGGSQTIDFPLTGALDAGG